MRDLAAVDQELDLGGQGEGARLVLLVFEHVAQRRRLGDLLGNYLLVDSGGHLALAVAVALRSEALVVRLPTAHVAPRRRLGDLLGNYPIESFSPQRD